ncbi:MAG: excinuclease ABC subunit A [Verrucomicrobia bacterium]|nr:excinuclease ABC subunit A [Verrucomicrobiota bacterium]
MTPPAAVPAIRLRGVRHNNLKHFDLDLPLERLIVMTGVSGSGKSSLAFDTLYAEGQRRYIETFSPYARQFFDRMDKPQVDRIDGLPPAIAIEQRNTVRTTRSTVGTLTELCDYLKVLWPHLAELHCRRCGQPVRQEPPQAVWEAVRAQTAGEVLITFELPLAEKLSLADSLALIAKQGYQRLLLNHRIVRVEDVPQNTPPALARLTVIQDRLTPAPHHRARFIEACEQAYHFGKGKLAVHLLTGNPPPPAAPDTAPRPPAAGAVLRFSRGRHCARCDLAYREPTPALFSFNHPLGACPVCKGFGRIISIDEGLAIPDRTLTLAQGAIRPWRSGFSAECHADLLKFCRARNVPADVPFEALTEAQQRWVVQGDPDYGTDDAHQWPHAWYGVKGYFRWLESKAYKMHVRVLLSRYRAYTTCPECHGQRLQPEALLYRLPATQAAAAAGKPSLSLADFYALPIEAALQVANELARSPRHPPGDPLRLALDEVRSRLGYLVATGLGYLTLDRPTRTLSGGETERVNLTACLGTRLVNTLFVLDEPSVGLHPRDTARLVRILERLRDTGNTVVVVEHEPQVIRAADQVVDLGPRSGEAGGRIVAQGPVADLIRSNSSLTGAYLSGRRHIPTPHRRPVRPPDGTAAAPPAGGAPFACPVLKITGARRHNLKNITVEIPLGRFVCLTGVSGSGKTTLVEEVLVPSLQAKLKQAPDPGKASDRLDADPDADPAGGDVPEARRQPATLAGWERLGGVRLVDQSPLGKSPRSTPAVYTGAFDHLRELFAQTEDARRQGFNASAFSFNSAQGQCERCHGVGFEKVEMQFLSDVFIRCPACNGRRYRDAILDVKLRSESPPAAWSIADLLEATVNEAVAFLETLPHSRPAARALAGLRLLQDVGLGYLRVGQPINTLSGGESQRLKLVRHLAEFGLRTRDAEPSADAAEPAGGAPWPVPGPPVLFVADEPTTGLHFDDVRVLLRVFQRLVDAGHSLLVIEHNLDVIRCADWVIDLGPEAGARGGNVVACGTPEQVAACPASHTGQFLRAVLAAPATPPPGHPAEAGLPAADAMALADALLPGAGGVEAGWPAREPAPGAISIVGAREHNLKNLALDIPRNRFVVVTGVSGSGKSTLAFDLLFAEGQRRFLDSMNTYARQFVEQLTRPEVDLIAGLPPTVSIEQRTTRGGGKSTVATVTEVYHFLRLLFARLGTQYCPDCGRPVQPQTRDQLVRRLQAEIKRRGPLRLLAPVVRHRKGFHSDIADWAVQHGYHTLRADGRLYDARQPFRLDRFREHDVEIVVGPLPSRPAPGRGRPPTAGAPPAKRSRELIGEALHLGQGTFFALDARRRVTVHSTERVCPGCGRSFPPLDPKSFSYNSPQGWCPMCRGFGELFWMPENVDRGERADAIEETWWNWQQDQREICPACHGSRLRPESRAVRLDDDGLQFPPGRFKSPPTIDDFSRLAVRAALETFRGVTLRGRAAAIARDILPEIVERLKFLDRVGLGYLQLGRGVTTLSGGEAQRIRLAAQLGSNLSGVLYILDEPTIGLHARDNRQLLQALARLRARGNSLIVVEHDEDTMRHADHIIDLGPGAGVHGGQVVASGTLAELLRHEQSVTGRCLRAQDAKRYPARGRRRPVHPAPAPARTGRSGRSGGEPGDTPPALVLHRAAAHNLKNLTVAFPLNRLVVLTGVSGSGKSTLIRDCLLPAVRAALAPGRRAAAAAAQPATRLTGYESLKAVYEVDQSPIGRTPRSVPATYVGFFDEIRRLFAQTPEARLRGYGPGRFSFNSAQGRCPECEGAGVIKLEMNFLPPAFVRCETCAGLRFNRETLDITYAGKNIAQVLDLSVEEALHVFRDIPKVRRPLEALHDTGLDYLKLGQTSPTLSGGEAQRVKLVTHLLSGLKPQLDLFDPLDRKRRRNLFILEEPTIGLHMADVRRLVDVLQRLVDAGHSVIVIEHNLDLIAEADWIIDLGPEGGDDGGTVVAAGTPETIARNPHSHTGRFLRPILKTARTPRARG